MTVQKIILKSHPQQLHKLHSGRLEGVMPGKTVIWGNQEFSISVKRLCPVAVTRMLAMFHLKKKKPKFTPGSRNTLISMPVNTQMG